MFSPKFNQVFNEAFYSATGSDFNDDDIQAEYHLAAEQLIEALVERWTDPQLDPAPITDFNSSRRSQTFRIKHPETKNFTEEDAADIAKVRFFGSQVLKAAQVALCENQIIELGDPETFESAVWRGAHPDVTFDDSLAYDPDAASPQRLRDWPEGEYMNCLGVAIAAAAESEILGTEYTFMNRLRHTRYEAATDVVQLLSRLEKICPEAFRLEIMMHQLDVARAESNNEDDASIKSKKLCILDESRLEFIFTHAYGIDLSFHHAVIQKNRQEDGVSASWKQFDPFGLVNSDISPRWLDDALSDDDLLQNPAACNEILLLDSDKQEIFSHSMAMAIDIAARSKRRLKKMMGNYESAETLEAIQIELDKSRQAIQIGFTPMDGDVRNMSDEYLFDAEYDEYTPDSHSLWISILGRSLQDDPRAFISYCRLLTDTVARQREATERGDPFEEDVQGAILQNVATSLFDNPDLQREFEETVLAMPYVFALHYSEDTIKRSVFAGESEKSMEVGDPAFQIGSMYLNHYARWRKDGIVNVASELARINPSQLIWQSAISQEGGFTSDGRVLAVGSLIKSLKRGQQHPLVRTTRKE